MPDLDLTALKALAKKATKGPWVAEYDRPEPITDYGQDVAGTCDESHARFQRAVRDGDIVRLCWLHSESGLDVDEVHEADALFIAACDPETILALIAEVEALRERRCENCAEWRKVEWPRDETWGECESPAIYRRADGVWTAPDHCCKAWRAKE